MEYLTYVEHMYLVSNTSDTNTTPTCVVSLNHSNFLNIYILMLCPVCVS